ncbi:hypothetical protein HDU91_001849, partial [Kappamyces sp. JEL0680]
MSPHKHWGRRLDLFTLALITFLKDDLLSFSSPSGSLTTQIRSLQPNASLLWLYFTSRPLRGCMYLGYSLKLGWNLLWALGDDRSLLPYWALVSLLGYSAYVNIVGDQVKEASKRDNVGTWFTSAADTKDMLGTWFLGGGNGE